MQGVVKIYDPETGYGVVVRDDDQSEAYLRPGSLEGSIFRTLRQGQRILFETADEGGKPYVARIRIGSDGY